MGAPRPTPAAIRRAIEGMQAAGTPVGGCQILRDGSVLVLRDSDPRLPTTADTLDSAPKDTHDARKPDPWT